MPEIYSYCFKTIGAICKIYNIIPPKGAIWICFCQKGLSGYLSAKRGYLIDIDPFGARH